MITKRVRIAGAALLLAFPGTSGAVQVPGGDSTEQLKIATTWLPARTSTSAPLRRTIALDLTRAAPDVELENHAVRVPPGACHEQARDVVLDMEEAALATHERPEGVE